MKYYKLIFLLAILSTVSGYLLSKASFVGRMGINLFYKEYKFLKVWWQGALVVFIVLLILLFLQGLAQKKMAPAKAKMLHFGAILAALMGLYFTYNDFRHTATHRLLGERFHLGGYLFWLGWVMISVYYLVQKRTLPEPENDVTPPATL